MYDLMGAVEDGFQANLSRAPDKPSWCVNSAHGHDPGFHLAGLAVIRRAEQVEAERRAWRGRRALARHRPRGGVDQRTLNPRVPGSLPHLSVSVTCLLGRGVRES